MKTTTKFVMKLMTYCQYSSMKNNQTLQSREAHIFSHTYINNG